MKEEIIKVIDEIKNLNWFYNIGSIQEKKTDKYSIRNVKSFDEFKENIESVEWEDVTLEAVNNLNTFLNDKRVKEYANYNKIVEEIKSNMDFVNILNEDFINKYSFDIKANLEWDILHYFLECYYLNYNKHIPLFFHELVNIYKEGNIPCGYESKREFDFSKGTILYY